MITPKAAPLSLLACLALSQAAVAQPQPLQNYIDLSRELNRLSQAQEAVRNSSFDHNDLMTVSSACAEAHDNTSLYVLHNVDPQSQDTTEELQLLNPLVSAQELSNMREFSDELEVLMPFAVECVGIMSSLVEPFWDSLDKDQQQTQIGGLNQTRGQILQTYNGIFTLSGAANVSGGFKSHALQSALKAAPAVAAILTPPDRETMSQSLRKYGYSASADQKSTIGTIEKVFADKTCNSICQMQ